LDALLLDLRLEIIRVREIHPHGLDRLEAAIHEIGDHAAARSLASLPLREVLRRGGGGVRPPEFGEPGADLRLMPREALIENLATVLELGEHALQLVHSLLVEALLLGKQLHERAQRLNALLGPALVLERFDDLLLLVVD